MGEFQKFLDAGSGPPQHLDHGPGPKRVGLFALGIESCLRLGQRGDEHRSGTPAAGRPAGAAIPLAAGGELLARLGLAGGGQDEFGLSQSVLGCGDEPREDRDQGARALLHAGLAVPGLLEVAADVGFADRAGGRPARPAGRVLQ